MGDSLNVTAVVDEIPLARDAHGVYRVGGPACIQVIGYYLKHADGLAEYLETRAREEERLLSSHPDWSPKGLRDRLLARRKAQ